MLIGILGGAGYAFVTPPLKTTQALVIVPTPRPNIATQNTIAGSTPILQGALGALHSSVSIESFVKQVTVATVTPNVLSITAKDTSAATAENEANAVATAYIIYIEGPNSPVGYVFAKVLVPASIATGTSSSSHIVQFGGGGLLAGALVGFLLAVRRSRADRRLRARDDIANAAGFPVLASVPAGQPSRGRKRRGAAAGPADSRQLRAVIDRLGIAPSGNVNGNGSKRSVIVVLSLSPDQKAAAVGSQLADFAASAGLRTALVTGAQPGLDGAAGLRADAAPAPLSSPQAEPLDAASPESADSAGSELTDTTGPESPDSAELEPAGATAPKAGSAAKAGSTAASAPVPSATGSGLPYQVLVVRPDDLGADWKQPDAALTVVAVVADSDFFVVPGLLRVAPVVLAVSAGAVTAPQLARAAAAVTESGGRIKGIVVADPEPGDLTRGLGPRPAVAIRPTAVKRLNGATALNGAATEIRQ